MVAPLVTCWVDSQDTQFTMVRKLPSVIDYALGDHGILRKIKYFSISDLTRYSDHCIIKLSVETKFRINTENTYPNLISAPPKFECNNIYKNRLCEAFSSTECQTSLANFYNF